MNALGSNERPFRVAVVGSGPSAFYATEALFQADAAVNVDMFERLPCPFGLVRLGVAPDHQKLKSAIRVYERIAASDCYRFFGNVTVGKHISVEELRTHYDAVIFAIGAETDRRLNIPGEDLPGSYTATEFVAWYNGHPDYHGRTFDLTRENAIVFGQGNVAVDVCRILAKTVDELKNTDIAQHALDALAESKVKNIYMIGRRGPVQAKFTSKEIREMGRLQDCDPVVDPADMRFDPLSQAEYENGGNTNAPKIVPILEEFSQRPAATKNRRLHVQFFKSPVEIIGNTCVEKVILERNELVGEPLKLRARGTGVTEELPCELILRSVGYRGVPMPGVPFDSHRGVIPNKDGRVTENDHALPGLYVVGWIKRGPTGLIGSNKRDSRATVEALLTDVPQLTPCPSPSSEAVLALLRERGVRCVSFEEWEKIDAAEVERGKPKDKPREKFTSVAEMLAVLDE